MQLKGFKGSIMKIKLACALMLLFSLALATSFDDYSNCPRILSDQETTMKPEKVELNQPYVFKRVLANGMTVLVRPVHSLPKVSLQIWYNVGGKDEKSGEKGIAHLIEHMIFKGTKQLSESDINVITHMLSGSTNAFTSYDYTGYLFNLPKQHWHEALNIFADSMQNVAFKDDHLNSEMKAVIQELKMNRDNYLRSLVMEMLASIFPDHPYHYPVIGYKQDLFDVHADRLRAFYKKHYWPNNATLVIVGDVDPEDAFAQAQKYFEKIPANKNYKKEEFYYNKDLISHNVTLYRDVQQPTAVVAYAIPGANTKNEHLLNVVDLILGEGKGSRLYRKIVDELQLATSLSCFSFLLFDHGIFFISYEPKNVADVPKINKLIQEEIDSIVKNGLTDIEFTRALKQARMAYYGLLESIETQAREIGKAYLATGDENFAFHFLDKPKQEVEAQIKELLGTYFKPAFMNTGMLLPLSEQDKKEWVKMQKESDEYDVKFLAARPRTSPIEPPIYAKKVKPKEATFFDFPKASTFVLDNGIKVLYYNNPSTPKINLLLSLKARDFYDSQKLPGLYNFLANVMQEGTKNYTAAELAQELESRGMALSIVPGMISLSMLATDLPKGLELLNEIITSPRFDDEEIEKVREQLKAEIKNFWDTPAAFSKQLISETVYKGHPYSKNTIGTKESIETITKQDLIDLHATLFSPDGARIAVVGDISGYDLKKELESHLRSWKGPKVDTIKFPELESVKPCQVIHPINRDQVVLCFAGLSVSRLNPDFDKLLLFDQIFGGGALGSLHSKLFQLREQSGLFYTISGSLVASADEQPGMVLVTTIVSLDRLTEAEKAIKGVIQNAVDEITISELQEAKHAIINSIVNNFATNKSMAAIFLNLDRFGFPADYYDTRAQKISAITLDQVKEAVKKVLSNDKMFTLKVGRLENKTNDK
jgi:zinc protease